MRSTSILIGTVVLSGAQVQDPRVTVRVTESHPAVSNSRWNSEDPGTLLCVENYLMDRRIWTHEITETHEN